MTSRSFALLLGTSMLLLSSSAFAVPVTPGTATATCPPTVGPTCLTDFTSGGPIAGTLEAFSTVVDPQPVGNVNGTFRVAVFRETATNQLDFLYQFITGTLDATNTTRTHPLGTASDPIMRISGDDFSGYTTDLGYLTSNAGINAAITGFFAPPSEPAAPVGDATPVQGQRTLSGTVAFNWSLSSAFNGTSDILVVRTNATSWGAGTVSATDGGSTGGAAYRPTPEPGTFGLLGGVLCLGLYLSRKYRISQV